MKQLTDVKGLIGKDEHLDASGNHQSLVESAVRLGESIVLAVAGVSDRRLNSSSTSRCSKVCDEIAFWVANQIAKPW
ncbi:MULTISPECIES: hypothetical protein [unclassified Ensifer]|jgi:hypothetical protein|uniref:hypothetical protein n=1 Tax=unclassified Ensifer TaxID=2633371 RepID=UPI00070F3D2C|nr:MULTISPECIES: hypothetical protein [unclassified Ensifer]KQW51016.1 hypothetical protein ASD02_32310 [Ensifer sp. Root1252]KRC54264.1 hypothetical protein ASE32_22360 [Ensifer sp. Root231]KRD01598.1 hypothetical protein ASE47_21735 [Ensifer sp. Root258]